MNNTQKKQKYQNRLTVLGILFVINLALFYIPGFPGSISEITSNSTEAVIPDMMWGYDADDISVFLTEIGPEGRAAFQRMHLTIDLVFPLIYGLLLCLLIHHYTGQTERPGKYLYLLGISPALFDLIENFSLVYITSQYPSPLTDLADIVQIFTYGKFFELIFLICFTIFLGIKLRLKKNNALN